MNIISINGVTLQTNKPGVNARGHKFKFSDGSTYNAKTGEFRNKGPGFVKANGRLLEDNSSGKQDAIKEPVVTQSREFPELSSLVLDLSSVSTRVETHDQPGIRVEMTGTASAIETIKLDPHGSRLHVNDGDENGNVSIISSGSISMSSGGFRIGRMSFGRKNSRPVTDTSGEVESIKVFVPVGTHISASVGTSCELFIDSVNGPLDLTASTSGEIRVNGASGKVALMASTSGDISIEGGDVNGLVASASTSGDIIFNGTARDADLDASTSGDVRVTRVINWPLTHESTSGRVWVGQIG